jgi:transposase-like protein
MTNITNPIFQDEAKAREFLETQRWPHGPVCPFCARRETVKPMGGKSMGDGWYHCKSCRKKFTVRVGTLYERSHVPLHKWLLATHLLCASKKGMSAHQLHRMLGVTYKTAWFMAHRIREGMRAEPINGPMGGDGKTVEADETFWGGSKHRRIGEPKRARGFQHKEKVLSLVERGGEVRSFHVKHVNSWTLRPILKEQVHKATSLMTDDAAYYHSIGRDFAEHRIINHSKGQYAKGADYTNTVEGFFAIFKRGMVGVYQHCGKQHLKRYLVEFDFRYNTRKITDDERAMLAIKGIEGRRLTYRRSPYGAYLEA